MQAPAYAYAGNFGYAVSYIILITSLIVNVNMAKVLIFFEYDL